MSGRNGKWSVRGYRLSTSPPRTPPLLPIRKSDDLDKPKSLFDRGPPVRSTGLFKPTFRTWTISFRVWVFQQRYLSARHAKAEVTTSILYPDFSLWRDARSDLVGEMLIRENEIQVRG